MEEGGKEGRTKKIHSSWQLSLSLGQGYIPLVWVKATYRLRESCQLEWIFLVHPSPSKFPCTCTRVGALQNNSMCSTAISIAGYHAVRTRLSTAVVHTLYCCPVEHLPLCTVHSLLKEWSLFSRLHNTQSWETMLQIFDSGRNDCWSP